MPKSKTYDEFVEKFKPKMTTDDCYTPPSVYAVIKNWACAEFGIDESTIARPFYPGGDYENYDYPAGCTVLDNPPFSILTKICEFYLDRGINFFLFAPSLTLLSGTKTVMRTSHIICDCDIVYENGASVRTSFITNYGAEDIVRSAPDLTRLINNAVWELRHETVRTLPKYSYPDHVLTSAMVQRYSKYGIDFRVRREDCVHVSKLDVQKAMGKAIFGAGLLLSDKAAAERAAAERAAAERAAAHVWTLSEREEAIVSGLGYRRDRTEEVNAHL